MRVLTVEPLAAGWSLSVSGVANAMMFRSGAVAETSARQIGARMAGAGEPAKLVVRLRDGSLGGRVLFAPALSSDEPVDLRLAA